jgi:hypothetical protein
VSATDSAEACPHLGRMNVGGWVHCIACRETLEMPPEQPPRPLLEADVRRIVREEIAAQIHEANLDAIEKELNTPWRPSSSVGVAASPSRLDHADGSNEGVTG